MKKHDIEQRTDEWHHLRKGKVTGTTLKALMSSRKDTREDAIYEIVAERLMVGVQSEENAMDRGTRLEPEAIAMFELETGKEVTIMGMCEDDEQPNIANSPDGLIGDTEAIEVKCMGGKNHVKMWLTNQVPDEYEWQVVQYFVVNEKLEKLYFVAYNPDIPVHMLHIIEVGRDEIQEKIDLARKTQEEFLLKVDNILKNIIEL